MFKKVFLVVSIAIFSVAFVQAQFTFGARAGFNFTNIYGDDEEGDFKPGFQLGVVGEIGITDAFSIQPGLLFSQQGSKGSETLYGVKLDVTMNLNYIQMPVNAQYKLDLGSMKLLFYGGPYLGYGIGGKLKIKAKEGTTKVSDSVKIKFGDGNDEDIMYIDNALDFGMGFGAGLQFGNFQTALGFNVGLASMFEDFSSKNNGLALTVTYLFGK